MCKKNKWKLIIVPIPPLTPLYFQPLSFNKPQKDKRNAPKIKEKPAYDKSWMSVENYLLYTKLVKMQKIHSWWL